jgi:hypothetical protein
LPIIRAFIHDPSFPVQDILGVRQASAIDFEDPQLELIPEIYLSSAYPTTDDVNDAIEANIRSAAAFLIQSGVAKYAKPAEKESIEAVQIRKDRAKPEEMPIFKRFKVTQLFEPIRGDFHALSKLERGKIPTVSRVAYDNGVVGYYAKPPDAKLYVPPKLTVSTVTGDTFVQLMCFIATDNVLILHPKVKLTRTSLFFIQAMINRERWRCTYGRQLYKEKFSKTEMYLPSDPDGKINEDYMRKTVEGCSYWGILEPYIDAIESASSKEESLENFLKA